MYDFMIVWLYNIYYSLSTVSWYDFSLSCWRSYEAILIGEDYDEGDEDDEDDEFTRTYCYFLPFRPLDARLICANISHKKR